jgi:hypothetical protein
MPESLHREFKLFFCYAHEDKILREKLETHLSGLKRQYNITTWSDQEILPGANWQQTIHNNLSDADIILLLISPDFIASDCCYSTEMSLAFEMHERGKNSVIPIILRPTDWRSAPFSKIQVLPTYGKPITQWNDYDAAFLDVVSGIRRKIEEFISPGQKRPSYSAPYSFQTTSTTYPSGQTNIFNPAHNPIVASSKSPKYNVKVFIALLITYVCGWVLAAPYSILTSDNTNTTVTSNSAPIYVYALYSIGIGLLVLEIISILILDWHRATTLCGRINWQNFKSKPRFFLACLYLCTFPVILAAYFIITATEYYKAYKKPSAQKINDKETQPTTATSTVASTNTQK